jgi:DNA-binding HxlR family transcriptional regulator
VKVPTGGTALALLAIPRNGAILRQLSDGPQSLGEMRQEGEVAPQTTLRKYLKGLEDDGLLVRRGRKDFPGMVEHALTASGEGMLIVIAALESWLAEKPRGSLLFDGAAGQSAIKSLSESWSSTVLQTMAVGPISLTGLANEIRTVSYPAVERRLSSMRMTGQVEASPEPGKATPYALTEWMQRGVAPLAAAVRWEQGHLPGAVQPMSRVEIDTAFLLAMPLLRVESSMAGSCRMDVRMDDDEEGPAGASAVVVKGKVISCAVARDDLSDSWATGSQPDWAETLTSSSSRQLTFGGDQPLGRALLDDLRLLLFPSAPPL